MRQPTVAVPVLVHGMSASNVYDMNETLRAHVTFQGDVALQLKIGRDVDVGCHQTNTLSRIPGLQIDVTIDVPVLVAESPVPVTRAVQDRSCCRMILYAGLASFRDVIKFGLPQR
jgi:hypothetical protein